MLRRPPRSTRTDTLFPYTTLVRSLLAVIDPTPRPAFGAVAGVATWVASYFGWIPAFGVLRSAETHPWRRNKLMISAHLVWGSVTAATLRDLTVARRTMLEQGQLRDAEPRKETEASRRCFRVIDQVPSQPQLRSQTGRASCRERGCQSG